MAEDFNPGALGEMRATSAANGGTALSTTAVCVAMLPGTTLIEVIPRNFATAVVAKLAINPYLLVYKTGDLLATVTDYSQAAQDGSTTTVVTLSSLATFANGGALYLGSAEKFRGVVADPATTNSTVSVLSGDYWSGAAWGALTVTDGTTTGGATLAQAGSITWTLPSDWGHTTLADAVATTGTAVNSRADSLFWVRLKVSVALDSSTTLYSLLALNRSTAYAEFPNGTAHTRRVRYGLGGAGCVEALTDAGTGNVVVNCYAAENGRFV